MNDAFQNVLDIILGVVKSFKAFFENIVAILKGEDEE